MKDYIDDSWILKLCSIVSKRDPHILEINPSGLFIMISLLTTLAGPTHDCPSLGNKQSSGGGGGLGGANLKDGLYN